MKATEGGETAFKEAYASLNAAQKEAVDTIEGPVMVIAGPGTGKTQILTLRIANILLKTDTAPENILAITFTDSGAKAMRERLRRYIGARAYQVSIHTFHSFAAQLIRQYPDAYPHILGGTPASELQKTRLIESILEDPAHAKLRPVGNPEYYVTPLLRQMSELKQEYVTPDQLAILVAKQETDLQSVEQYHTKGAHKGKVRGEYTKLAGVVEKNQVLLSVYRQYEELLRSEKLFDFDDMITSTVAALESNADMLLDLQETYQYVLADEHQDVNGSQNKILEALSAYHEVPNIFVVGDEKQAIYRFQGASLENFLYFEEKFTNAKTIALTENYRSGQSVLDSAHSLVAVESGPLKDLRVPLTAASVEQATVETATFSHQAVEDDWLVETIMSSLESGTVPDEIAVIVRTNREVEALAARLRDAGVTVAASADGDILEHPYTHSILDLLRTVAEPTNDTALFRVLHGAYWGLKIEDMMALVSARRYDRSLQTLLSEARDSNELGLQQPEKVAMIHDVIIAARTETGAVAPQRVLEQLLEASGFLTWVAAIDSLSGARVIRRLYDEIQAAVQAGSVETVTDIVAMLENHQQYNLPLNAPYIVNNSASVTVMTAHKAKGLEYQEVYVAHLNDRAWGGSRKRQNFTIPFERALAEADFDPLDDERRLLYVAMTRAKERLVMSCSEMSHDAKELTPSRFLSEIDASTFSTVDVSAAEAAFDPLKKLSTASSLQSVVDPALIAHVLSERGFSATALNNYLDSPWTYFYRNVLRYPQTQPLPMQFGTAMHSVLDAAVAIYGKEGKWPNESALKQSLEEALNRLPLTAHEYTQLLEKGLDAVYPYIAHLEQTITPECKREFSIRVTLETGLSELPELPLTGALDRIDFDGDGNALRVVDYKTGKPKSRNVIEGKTQSSNGGYKRQLVFYALLLSLYEDERYQTRKGVLSFVEPTSSGVIKEEAFVISDEEIEALKTEIISAVSNLLSGEAFNDPCNPEVCEYCDLVNLLER